MQHTGLDPVTVARIDEGAVVMRVYYVFPGHYTISEDGNEYGSYRDALFAAIQNKTDEVKKHLGAYEVTRNEVLDQPTSEDGVPPVAPDYVPLPETLWVDTRWVMAPPTGGAMDTVVSRTRYDDLSDAVEHLDRIAVPGEY